MKIRKSFISNSSSSSFIVIDSNISLDRKLFIDDGSFILGDDGEYKFGWQIEDYRDICSKINFCYIQAKYINNNEYIEMLYKVLKEYFPELNEIVPILTIYSDNIKYVEHPLYGDLKTKDAYIDHQSSSSEGQNLEMFESEDKLRSFLFSVNSYIHNDNDNH